MKQIAESACFGGRQYRFEHHSITLACLMRFSIYLPPLPTETGQGPGMTRLPVLYWLSGLSCTDENFIQKAGAQRLAAELGMILVAPDTSPRGEGVADDPGQAYDLGLGAGFYINASETPWAANYRMFDYVAEELPALVCRHFPVDPERQSVSGHSMGGHGALVLALRKPACFRSVSAFAPICAPASCPWGRKAFTAYLGTDESAWQQYDATRLMSGISEFTLPLLIDQGDADPFLQEQLQPELLLAAARQNGVSIDYRLRPGYDHSYFYIASFIAEHLQFHFAALTA
ncbi:MAG: S-formylglutathione hydrolase [Pseudomonadales bacterium]|nr:S-formylglutathione hydrolase [Pseudomonadales bacterium]